ncbi:MAG: gluconate 2-dehydrogenase subunit 3 family protein [Alphaproteobacteria bacterium]|nr:gluconate 2-dehydrogenase subunit 3 family protein [Alphaproteobacteria bacterium]
MPNALVSRRSLLRAGVLAAGVGVTARFLVLGAAAPGREIVNEHGLEIIEALGELFFPEGNAIGPSWRDVDLASRVDRILSQTLDPTAAEGFRYLLRGLDYASVVTHSTRFCVATVDQRAAILEAWESELPTRLGHAALKSVFGMAYFNHPSVREAVGFASRCHGEHA